MWQWKYVKNSNCRFNLSIPMALTNLWTELTSCLAVVLIHHGVLLQAITQLETQSILAHGSKRSSEFLGYKD